MFRRSRAILLPPNFQLQRRFQRAILGTLANYRLQIVSSAQILFVANKSLPGIPTLRQSAGCYDVMTPSVLNGHDQSPVRGIVGQLTGSIAYESGKGKKKFLFQFPGLFYFNSNVGPTPDPAEDFHFRNSQTGIIIQAFLGLPSRRRTWGRDRPSRSDHARTRCVARWTRGRRT
jgi:hypothetical protein